MKNFLKTILKLTIETTHNSSIKIQIKSNTKSMLRGQRFCDDSAKALFLKCVAMWERVSNNPKFRVVIYERPLT